MVAGLPTRIPGAKALSVKRHVSLENGTVLLKSKSWRLIVWRWRANKAARIHPVFSRPGPQSHIFIASFLPAQDLS
jgi:hypothetical protein